MKIGIDFGHNCSPNNTGAIGIRFEDELIVETGTKVVNKLRSLGHEVILLKPESNYIGNTLSQRVAKANINNVDLVISIHFNKTTGGYGTEAYAISTKGREYAQRIVYEIATLGYRNRGVKDGSGLALVNGTNAVSVLVECCFVDSQEDMNRYNAESLAVAIVKGITGHEITEPQPIIKEEEEVITLPTLFNRQFYLFANPDVAKAVNEGKITAEDHYLNYGYREGRVCCAYIPQGFNAEEYLKNYPDVAKAVNDGVLKSAEEHYIYYGIYEGRGWFPIVAVVIEKSIDKEELKNRIANTIDEVVQ